MNPCPNIAVKSFQQLAKMKGRSIVKWDYRLISQASIGYAQQLKNRLKYCTAIFGLVGHIDVRCMTVVMTLM